MISKQAWATGSSVVREAGIWAPILVVTSVSSVEEQIRALDEGADDCVSRPLVTAELVAPADGRGPRAALTTIYFLLPAGTNSRWHRVESDEISAWIEYQRWLAGPPIVWRTAGVWPMSRRVSMV